jgi:hypothetical protein
MNTVKKEKLMRIVSKTESLPDEYVSIFKVVDRFIPFHTKDSERKFVSSPELDARVAITAAIRFAEEQGLPFAQDRIFTSQKPIISIVECQNKWYPAQYYPEKATVLKKYASIELTGEKENALWMAKLIADSTGSDFIPELSLKFPNGLPGL